LSKIYHPASTSFFPQEERNFQMSFYATLSGEIKFKDPAAFERIIQMLKDQEYINENNVFLDECGEEMGNGNVLLPMTIVIPWGLYRNFSRILDDIFDMEDVDGKIVGTSTDGCFDGWVLEKRNGVKTSKDYNLNEWAKENDKENDNGEEIPDEDSDDYVDWLNDVESDFHATVGD
jgi:hypothetical protein